MLRNRFENCKTLKDLYNVFCNEEDVEDFNKLSEAELERVAIVFEANLPRAAVLPVVPLNEKGYTYIWNVTVEEVETEPITEENMEEETMENNTNATPNANIIKEDEGMTNFKQALENAAKQAADAKSNIKVKAGQTVEEYFDTVDDSVNVVKGAFGSVIKVLDDFTGFSSLKADILDIYHAGERANGKKDLFKMAEKCRVRIDAEIKSIDELSDIGLMDDKEARKLKDVLTDLKGSDIFHKFAVSLVFIAKKVIRKLSEWFNVQGQKQNVFGSICRSIAGFIEVLKAGLKIVWDTTKFAVSFLISGVMIIAAPIIKAIKSLVEKVKGWLENKFKKVEEFEETFEDDDLEDVDDEDINE